jgi:glutamyl-tRNA reductase
MVKSSSQSRKKPKFVIDLGPEIDRIVKKKIEKRDLKIEKQKVIIRKLTKEISVDPKSQKHKAIILDLQTKLSTSEKIANNFEKELRIYKIRRVTISNKTVNNAFRNLRDGKSLHKMQPNTMLLIQQSGRWDEARKISAQMKLC